jgi:hypothetical protein
MVPPPDDFQSTPPAQLNVTVEQDSVSATPFDQAPGQADEKAGSGRT